jgi:F-type H+-transporting ATPase subunit epsilon
MAAGTLYVEIVAPDRSAFRGEATSFRAPGVEGSFEVLYNHAPMIAATGVGPVTITTPGGESVQFATSGGVVEVLDNRVIMVTETAEPVGEIDLERAKAAEERARERLRESQTPEERAAAEADLERSRNRARLALGRVGAGR